MVLTAQLLFSELLTKGLVIQKELHCCGQSVSQYTFWMKRDDNLFQIADVAFDIPSKTLEILNYCPKCGDDLLHFEDKNLVWTNCENIPYAKYKYDQFIPTICSNCFRMYYHLKNLKPKGVINHAI